MLADVIAGEVPSLNGAGERTVGTYSGGMVQRLGLAVAMLPEAPVFLLDEPTAALDPEGLSAFYGLVEHAREDGRAVLFISHQLGDAERLADRFAILVGGRLVADLTAPELKDRLAERGVMRLRLAMRPGGFLDAARVLAPGATWAGEPREGSSGRDKELIVPGPASLRPRVLDTVRTLGVPMMTTSAWGGKGTVILPSRSRGSSDERPSKPEGSEMRIRALRQGETLQDYAFFLA